MSQNVKKISEEFNSTVFRVFAALTPEAVDAEFEKLKHMRKPTREAAIKALEDKVVSDAAVLGLLQKENWQSQLGRYGTQTPEQEQVTLAAVQAETQICLNLVKIKGAEANLFVRMFVKEVGNLTDGEYHTAEAHLKAKVKAFQDWTADCLSGTARLKPNPCRPYKDISI